MELNKNSTKERILRDDLSRLLLLYQMFKRSLESIRTSDTIKEWAAIAKANKNKDFVDFRVLAANQQRSIDVMLLNMKKSFNSYTWNQLMIILSAEQFFEIDLLIDEVKELDADTIKRITEEIKKGKVENGIFPDNINDKLYENN